MGHPHLIDEETEAQIILGSGRAGFKPKLSLMPTLSEMGEISSAKLQGNVTERQAVAIYYVYGLGQFIGLAELLFSYL